MVCRLSAAIPLLLASAALASPVDLQVDPTQSSVTVTLCMTFGSTQCDSDTSPVVGYATLSLDCLSNPNSLTLHDFDFLLTQPLDFHLDFGWLTGTFDATASNVEIFYATPGFPMPPTPLAAAGAYAYTGIPADMVGQLAYSATLLVCAAFQVSGYLCNDTIDLSTLTLNPVDMDGAVAVSGRDVTMTINIDTSAPLDPLNPELGNISMVGTIVAGGFVPLPDVTTFIGVLLGNVTAPELVWDCDMNADCVVNALDIQPYIDALLTP